MSRSGTRSVFVQWPLLLRESRRVLDDLGTCTELNTIELSNFFLDWGEADSTDAPKPAAPLALPSTGGFSDLPVPVLDDSAFESVREVTDRIHGGGFSVACNVAPLYLSDASLSSVACVDITGKPVRGLRSSLPVYGCPNNPLVLAYGEAMMREFATCWEAADAISLNHVEYPFWPQDGLSELFVCFCDSCREAAESAGLDFERIKRDVASAYESLTTRRRRAGTRMTWSALDLLAFLIERPYLAAWLDFRTSSMSEYARRVVAAGREAPPRHDRALQIGLEFQAPALALLVGTDFRTLAPSFDWLTPKLPDYLAAAVVPIIAREIAAASEGGEAAELQAMLRELLLLGRGPDEYEPAAEPSEGILYRNAFDPEMIDLHLAYVSDLSAANVLYPYVWQYGRDVESLGTKLRKLSEHGFDGFFMWVWDADLTTDALKRAGHVLR